MELKDISLRDFIEVYNGNTECINGDEILAKNLIEDYVSIVGGTGISSAIMKHNERINLNCYLNIIHACEVLISLGYFKDVCDVLKELGYSAKESDTEGIKRRVSSLKASFKLKLERLNAMKDDEVKDKDNDYFSKEIATVCTHYKMTIDKDKLSAKEYAYIVKTMSKEIKELNNRARRK